MTELEKFLQESRETVSAMAADERVSSAKNALLDAIVPYKYSYNYTWMGRPIIQFPQDMVAMQELIWEVKPDVVIETGVAHGGSLIFTASLLAMLDYEDAQREGKVLDPAKPSRTVVGIDIEIRPHNREAIEASSMFSRIDLVEGSSIDHAVIEQVHSLVAGKQRVLVCLDSNHTHDHVLAELNAYAPLVSRGSYCVVMDTAVENMPEGSFPDRPWDKGDNPWTAAQEYIRINQDFEVDESIPDKLLLTVAPDGFLRRK